jgi:hypothetical protein
MSKEFLLDASVDIIKIIIWSSLMFFFVDYCRGERDWLTITGTELFLIATYLFTVVEIRFELRRVREEVRRLK